MKYKVWWMKGEKIQNFGDVLTPVILDYYNIPYEYCQSVVDSNLICVGSISSKATDGCIVLGSGIAWENTKLNVKADWKFVRGPLTRKALIKSGGDCPEIYGDPALLIPNFCSESKKEHDIGIIPHYKEYKIIREKYPNINVINLNNTNPLLVAKEITKCRKIISSSLHGIIASHAYEIPCAWVKFSNLVIGDDTKFKDHFDSVKLNGVLSSIDDPIFQTPIGLKFNKIEEIFKSLVVNR
jgi:hypothetical protein